MIRHVAECDHCHKQEAALSIPASYQSGSITYTTPMSASYKVPKDWFTVQADTGTRQYCSLVCVRDGADRDLA